MYEHLRNDFVAKLTDSYGVADIDRISKIFDEIMYNYDVKEKETHLILYCDAMPQLCEKYLAAKQLEGMSANSIKLYRNRLRCFFETVRIDPVNIKTDDIRNFLAQYPKTHNIKQISVDKIRQVINCFYEWCVMEDYIDKNPCKKIKKLKYIDNHRQAFSDYEVEMLRNKCQTLRERAILETLLSTGFRVSELCRMRFSEINLEDKSISVLGKGKKIVTGYFNAKSQLAINLYYDSRENKSDWVFVNSRNPNKPISKATVEKMFRDLSERCGFYACPHRCRHTLATKMIDADCPIDIVSKTLNHSSVAITERYVHRNKEEIKLAHNKYAS